MNTHSEYLKLLSRLYLPKDRYSGRNQLSMTLIKYDHHQVMETIIGKFHQYPFRNVGGVAETRTSVDKWLKLTKGYNLFR